MERKIVHFIRVKYFSRWLILTADLFISVFVSLLSFIFAVYITNQSVPEGNFLRLFIASTVCSLGAFFLCGTYRGIIRHSTIGEIWRIGIAVFFKVSILLLCLELVGTLFIYNQLLLAIVIDFLMTIISLTILRAFWVAAYKAIIKNQYQKTDHVLIYGTTANSAALATLPRESLFGYRIAGFLAVGKRHKFGRIAGYSVYSIQNQEEFSALMERNQVHAILFPNYKNIQSEQERIVRFCEKCKIKMLVLPQLDEVEGGKIIPTQQVREVSIEDLLGRDEIHLNMMEIQSFLTGQVVMVTGAAGSIGSELCRQLAGFDVKQLLLFDSAETPMHMIRLELEDRFPSLNFVPIIGDVRSEARVDFAFRSYHPTVVFHAAAYKHVPLMEANPCEAVRVNVTGSRNVADYAVKYGVKKFVMISTDKAVNPTNVMGASKRLAEIYIQSLSIALRNGEVKGNTRFITTRFGNVLGSNGSVIPRFKEQIRNGGPVTVTHPDIIRYFMTIPEACRLVMEAATMGKGAEIFVFEMGKPVRIADLAWRMIELSGLTPNQDIDIEYTGLRPGEKLYEELLSDNENTKPTCHEKIRIASVREYSYEEIATVITRLTRLSLDVQIRETVSLMKDVVPEFKSENSVYEELDKKRLVAQV